MKIKTKSHLNKQKKYFEKDLEIYSRYQENLNPWRKSYIRRMHESLLGKKFRNKALVDVGAGSGYVSVEMAKKGIKVYACDITPKAIKNLEKHKKNFKLRNLKLFKCRAEKIPLPKSSADYIVANAILEHVPNESKAISEWKRILKPGGKIFITAPIKYLYLWPFLWPLNYMHDNILGHLRRYDEKEFENRFEMKAKRVYYTGHLAKTLWLVLSRLFVLNLRKNLLLDGYFERLDQKLENKKYGSSNVIVILQK